MSEALEDVLAAHVRLTYSDRPFTCSCEPHVSDASGMHRAHVAAEVRAWLARLAGDAEVRESPTREDLRRPPCWGPDERGDFMVDMTVEAYEDDLDQLARGTLSAFLRAAGIELALGSGDGAAVAQIGSNAGSGANEGDE